MSSADNQQERPDARLCSYIAGFVDGEGSFHIAVQRSRFTRVGLQVIPEFHVSQHRERASILKVIQDVLGCGYIKQNHPGNASDRTMVLVVRDRQDLTERVVPFFKEYPLRSEKQREVEAFAAILEAIGRGEHLTKNGMARILTRAFAMNAGRYRKRTLKEFLGILESSETVRQGSRKQGRKIQSGLHGDMQRFPPKKLADPPIARDAAEAEMTNPPVIVDGS